MSGYTRESMPIFLKSKAVIKKTSPMALFPSKEFEDDVGYSVTLTTRVDNRDEDTAHAVNLYGTSLEITPPDKHYFRIIALPTLHKHGYTLASGECIIGPNHTGEVIIPLYKFTQEDDFDLPFKAVQLILCPIVYAHVCEAIAPKQLGGYQPQQEYGMQQGYGGPPQQGYYQPQSNQRQPMRQTPVSRGGRRGGQTGMY